jgi:hypothetical protein
MIVLSRAPEMASRSLASLAAPGTEKLYRKQLLLEVASRRLGLSEADSTTRVKPRTRSHWGNSFTVDVLSIFFVQEYGRAFVEEWMELPEDDEFCAIVESDLSFYLKYNANLIGYIPREVRNAVLNSFHECGLFPYNELDYQSFDRVRRYLARTYDI